MTFRGSKQNGRHHNNRRSGGRGGSSWRRRIRRMADYFTAASLLCMVAVGAAWFAQLGEQEISGPFAVMDGDSLEAKGQRYRLKGIDAPEYAQTCRKEGAEWPCGRAAARQLRRLVRQPGTACTGVEIDKFDRLLVTCRAAGANLNRQMVLEGWAVSFGDYEAEERLARRAGSGIWAGKFERPRDWRELHGELSEAGADGNPAANFAASVVNRGRLWLQSITNWFGD